MAPLQIYLLNQRIHCISHLHILSLYYSTSCHHAVFFLVHEVYASQIVVPQKFCIYTSCLCFIQTQKPPKQYNRQYVLYDVQIHKSTNYHNILCIIKHCMSLQQSQDHCTSGFSHLGAAQWSWLPGQRERAKH